MTMMLVPCDQVPDGGISVLAHEVAPVDQQQHENDDDRQQNAVEHLGENCDVDELRIWQQQYGERAARDEQGIEPVEERRFLEALVDA